MDADLLPESTGKDHDRLLTWGESISAQRSKFTQCHETVRYSKNHITAIGRRSGKRAARRPGATGTIGRKVTGKNGQAGGKITGNRTR